jgi:precorrin-3B synthase
MSLAAAFEVKGWCPGALRPMASGDGLLVRIRPWCGAFTLDQAAGLAGIAARLGNGRLDLTRRANLQIRGLAAERLPALHEALGDLGLLDADARTEAARNIMVGPFAGPAARMLARELSCHLDLDAPPKSGWLVDGPPFTIVDQRADVAFCLVGRGVAVRRGGQWLGVASRDEVFAPSPRFAPLNEVPIAGSRPAGIAAPFGRLQAPQLCDLVALARRSGASEMRLSPWRALYFDAPVAGAETLGLIVDADDPLLRIDACPGAPDCRSSSVDTRGDARRIAARGFAGSIHVSGCAKGCARSAVADLVLVGEQGRYGIIRNGTARDRAGWHIDASDILKVLDA